VNVHVLENEWMLKNVKELLSQKKNFNFKKDLKKYILILSTGRVIVAYKNTKPF